MTWRVGEKRALQHTATRCNTLQHAAPHRNTLQRTATHCNAPQHTATQCDTQPQGEEWGAAGNARRLPPHSHCNCNTLQHTATHCNTLQHAATHCNTGNGTIGLPPSMHTIIVTTWRDPHLSYYLMCDMCDVTRDVTCICGVWTVCVSCVAVCCSVLQCVAMCVTWRFLTRVTVAVCCSMLQCVAAYCRVCHMTFPCVCHCCSVLQCVSHDVPYVWMCDMSYVTWLVTWRVGAKCGAAGDARRLPPPRKHCGPLEYQRAQHYHVWQALHARAHARRAKPRAQRL